MHERSVTLVLRKHLVARGRVTAPDGFTGCESAATVEIFRRRAGAERLIATVQTSNDGSFAKRVADRRGTYIARVAENTVSDGADRCGAASATARHRH